MGITKRFFIGLGIVIVASAAFYMGALGQSRAYGQEGFGGASEGVYLNDAPSGPISDATYLATIAFIRGHLNVGVQLYQEGHAEASATHMKHPGDELYAMLLPALNARGARGFADQLEALAVAVEGGAPLAEVNQAYEDLQAAMTRAEERVLNQDAPMLGQIIADLVSTAAFEYDIAVGDDLQLENEHEYQDALGFIRIALQVVERLDEASGAPAVDTIRTELDALLPVWPAIRAPQTLTTAPSVLAEAAQRIETATRSL